MANTFSKRIQNQKVYAKHGKRTPLGIPMIVDGQKALVNYDGTGYTGYTTLDEINELFYSNKNLQSIKSSDFKSDISMMSNRIRNI